jgi:hypothetical protein
MPSSSPRRSSGVGRLVTTTKTQLRGLITYTVNDALPLHPRMFCPFHEPLEIGYGERVAILTLKQAPILPTAQATPAPSTSAWWWRWFLSSSIGSVSISNSTRNVTVSVYYSQSSRGKVTDRCVNYRGLLNMHR